MDKILDKLELTQLLSLRRVSAATRNWVSDTNPSGFEKCHLKIFTDTDKETWKSFHTAMEMKLKIPSIHIENFKERDGFYKSLHSSYSVYGSHIRKLRLTTFCVFSTKEELSFFLLLPNLQDFKADFFTAIGRKDFKRKKSKHSILFPGCFHSLRVLKIGYFQEPHRVNELCFWALVHTCANLEYLRLPGVVAKQDSPGPISIGIPLYMSNGSEYLRGYLEKSFTGKEFTHLKTLDFKYARVQQQYPDFSWLSQLFSLGSEQKRLDIAHIDPRHLFQSFTQTPSPDLWCKGRITSMRNYFHFQTPFELPLLTKLFININAQFLSELFSPTQAPAAKWPCLKHITIWFHVGHFSWLEPLDYLFKQIERNGVESLGIGYTEETCKDPVALGLISASTIASYFTNLRVLHLIEWNKTNVDFLCLWKGLKNLEELTLSSCATFGNAALIGENEDQPAFLNLESKFFKFSLVR